jgi:transposase
VIEHAAPCACPNCGGALRSLGEDVTEVLDYTPASFRVIRHVRPKLALPQLRDHRAGRGPEPAHSAYNPDGGMNVLMPSAA